MSDPEPTIRIPVDVTNPGQFFACCGLLELADRLWPGAEGWFADEHFQLSAMDASLASLSGRLQEATIVPVADSGDPKTCPILIKSSELSDRNEAWSMVVDWWREDGAVGGSLKTWAGQQRVFTIAAAMWHTALRSGIDSGLFNQAKLAFPPSSSKKPVAPFYFDARRFSDSLDTGFSLDVQEASVLGHPAVEILALIGLQRFRPRLISRRKYRYSVWSTPLSPVPGSAAAASELPLMAAYDFILVSRDNQDRYKAFSFATPTGDHHER